MNMLVRPVFIIISEKSYKKNSALYDGVSTYIKPHLTENLLKPPDVVQSELNQLLSAHGLRTGGPYGKPKLVDSPSEKGYQYRLDNRTN